LVISAVDVGAYASQHSDCFVVARLCGQEESCLSFIIFQIDWDAMVVEDCQVVGYSE
jgi:hypothetical protein